MEKNKVDQARLEERRGGKEGKGEERRGIEISLGMKSVIYSSRKTVKRE